MPAVEPVWMAEARKLLGTREIAGAKNEPAIVRLFAEAGHSGIKDDETAWCAAFVNAMLRRSGAKGTGKLNARSFLDWGIELESPIPGCIVVFKRGNSSWQGHVAFYVSQTGTKVNVLGGNQRNSVSVFGYERQDVLGYRWPDDEGPARTLLQAQDKKALTEVRMGTVGDHVRELQEKLKELHYPIGGVDGIFGNVTRDAVLAWQADYGRPTTGTLSPRDLESILNSTEPRKLSEARSFASTAEVVQASPVAANLSIGAKVSGAVAVVSATLSALDAAGVLPNGAELAAQASQMGDLVQAAVGLFQFVNENRATALTAVLAVVAYFAWTALRARVQEHRTGGAL